MRRRRSNTIYAESIEEYKKVLVGGGHEAMESTQQKSPKTQRRSKSSTSNDDLWLEFDFNRKRDVPEGLTSGEAVESTDFSNNNSLGTTDDTSNPTPTKKDLIVKKIMVIGLRGAGKHFLVNSAFHSEEEKDITPLKQTMDFILKTEDDSLHRKKYHFWIRELNEHKFDSLVKMYYKFISLFIFVYSVTDRSSFEELEEAIEAVRKEVPRERFNGVILANKSDLKKKRDVSHAEGIALKEKMKLSLFIDATEGEVSQRLHETLSLLI